MSEPLIEVHDLHHTYLAGTPFAVPALSGISMRIERGELLGIVGASRSGKSTLIQFFNGLLTPARGRITVSGVDGVPAGAARRELRRRVGLVFQYPEAQLFADTVADDVAFGPVNFGVPDEQIDDRVDAALERLHLDPKEYADRPISALSGGEKRRVAIAGVLASEPELLVLDEPTAGIDPDSRAGLWRRLVELRESGTTVVVASNSAVELAPLAQRLLVLDEGTVLAEGTPAEVLSRPEVVARTGIGLPDSFEVLRRLAVAGHAVPAGVFDPGAAADAIAGLVKGAG